ncbi:ATP-dependent RNA helicase DbpA [Halarcobacter ebronensis]|uniref:ATP-dependent RNA helicase DbpA n=1 Tax=Halarcobacter ebronensis TaxID=1462615 RepID=A0A4Q1AKV4_9BACT|nr:ATP-dependent RNA helicase DbpA [Halarcobacter ebronensis]QKF81593.1 DEAD-box ATP-dependent RNA helicase [Halarcobacter ebronensis]RXK05521.1 ATP-dependent RNA helicase DbpA [Halarcobacter ebronensis]
MQFSSLEIKKEILEALDTLEYKNMTKVQDLSLLHTLEKKDVIVQSKTGSGKTLAFAIPVVNLLDIKKYRIQTLILAPTRELANQIADEIKKICRFIPNIKVLTLCGGVPFKPQVASLEHGAHIVVGTVGRVMQHIYETKIDLSSIENFVLDEADKMLDMGFYEDILKIVEVLPKQRQTMLFSATYEENIKELANSVLTNPLYIKNEEVHKQDSIEQKFYKVEESSKLESLLRLISYYKMESILIFCSTKVMCNELADDLSDAGVDTLLLHSDLDQKQRDETVVLFSNGSYPILIATDIVSRGIDITDIKYVINYNIPKDETIYTHRIGRTARGEANGVSITLYSEEENYKVKPIKEKFSDIEFNDIYNLEVDKISLPKPVFRTMMILGGKKQKLRAGDILGSLTADIGLKKEDVGKINILDFVSYVAIKSEVFEATFNKLQKRKIKGKYFKLYEK